MKTPDRIYIPTAFVAQAQKNGTGTYYPNFTGDPAQFGLVAYVPESRVADEREAAFRDVKRVIAEAAAKCPVFIFHSKQGKEFLMNALETASTGSRKGEG